MATEELLSPEGIDALLDRFRARKRRQDDLARSASDWEADQPSALGRRSLTAMELRFGMIAERMGTELSAVLRRHVTTRLERFCQVRFRSVVDRVPRRATIIELAVAESKLPAFVIMDAVTTTSIIDLLVGGGGEADPIERDLTGIEQRVLRDIVNPFVSSHSRVLSGISPFTPSWHAYHGAQAALRAFPPTEVHLQARYEIQVQDEIAWVLDFVLPLTELIPSIDRAAAIPVQTAELAEDRRRGLRRALADVEVDASVEIGSADLRLADVTSLEVGDVLVLDTRPGHAFTLSIEGVPKYRGTLGRIGRGMAFRVAGDARAASNPPSTEDAR